MSMVCKHLVAGLFVAAAGCLLPAAGRAEDQRVVTCPAGKSYCTAETRPILSAPDAARADGLGRGEAIAYDPGNEARKKQARIDSGYRDPSSTSLCPPPRRMTQRD